MKIVGALGLTAVTLMSTQTYAVDEKAGGGDAASSLLGSYTLVAGRRTARRSRPSVCRARQRVSQKPLSPHLIRIKKKLMP